MYCTCTLYQTIQLATLNQVLVTLFILCVCESYIGKPIDTCAMPQAVHHRGGKATNTDRTKKN